MLGKNGAVSVDFHVLLELKDLMPLWFEMIIKGIISEFLIISLLMRLIFYGSKEECEAHKEVVFKCLVEVKYSNLLYGSYFSWLNNQIAYSNKWTA